MAYFPGDVQELSITQFRGSAQYSDPYTLDLDHGLYSQNIDFIVGPTGLVQAISRRGTSQVAQLPNADGAVTSLFSWYFSNAGTQNCFAVYYATAVGAKAYNQLTTSFVALVAVTGAAYLSFATDGIRGYFAFGDSTGRTGTATGSLYNAATATSDALFAQPPNWSITSAINGAAGVVTAGIHRVGFTYTTRNGYTGPPGPWAPGPVSNTVVTSPVPTGTPDGAHTLVVTINVPSIPTYMAGGTVQIYLSSAANNARYFLVPGATANVPGSPGTIVITVNITDGDLVTGTDITQNQGLLTANQLGTPPFKPSAVFTFSSRMGYITIDPSGFPAVALSDQNNYQSLTLAFHFIYLEGRQIPVQGASIGAICYIATLSGLYSSSDNGGFPSTWTPPARVDGSVGVLAPSCLLASSGRILLASEKGLFSYRGGAFPSVPLSYWQTPDWNRINWAAPTQVIITDDALDRVIRVIAPLKVQVTAASNTNPITITTGISIGSDTPAYPHLYQTGLSVTIAGVTGNTNANGTFTITVTGANTFTVPAVGNGAYTGGGTVTPNTPNAEMSFNYSLGEALGELLYSLNAFTAYRMGASATVRNINTNYDETWFASSATNPGGLIRRVVPSDSLIHRDVDMSGTASAINALYETGIVPGQTNPSTTVRDFHACHLRASGSGNLALTVYGLDHVRSVVPLASPIALSAVPGSEYLIKFFLRSGQASINFGTNAIDAYFLAALLKHYYAPSLPIR